MEKKIIEVVVYDRIERWHDRRAAVEFFCQGAEECDGLEASRYARVAADLMAGAEIAEDGESASYRECVRRGWRLVTSAPDGSRDFGGEIWFPKR